MWLSRRRLAGAQVAGAAAGSALALASRVAAIVSSRPASASMPSFSAAQLDAIRTLEECAFNAWPAQKIATCNGWVLRLSDGYTKRANSANALSPTGRFEETRALAEAFYARHDQPAIFRLSPLAGAAADQHLAQAGYLPTGETLVLCAPLQLPAGDDYVSPTTNRDHKTPVNLVKPHADAAWRRGYADAAGVPDAARGLHDRLLDAIAMPCGFIRSGPPAAPVAFGMGVLERGMLGLFDIVVHPAARRQGAARQLMAGLLDWGRRQGATRAYLQVVADNAPALALYHGLGFREAYRYHYRIPA